MRDSILFAVLPNCRKSWRYSLAAGNKGVKRASKHFVRYLDKTPLHGFNHLHITIVKISSRDHRHTYYPYYTYHRPAP